MPPRRVFRSPARPRTCRHDGCARPAAPGAAHCPAHARTPEALALRRDLQSTAASLDRAAEPPASGPDADRAPRDELDDRDERAAAFHRFRARASRGEFDRLLDAPTRRLLDQAAELGGFRLELGALRFGLMRLLSEETDPARLALGLARLSNAAVRATAAQAGVDADRDEALEADREAEWLDRVSEAVLGFTREGRNFATTSAALQAFRRRQQAPDRWAEPQRLRALTDAHTAARQPQPPAASDPPAPPPAPTGAAPVGAGPVEAAFRRDDPASAAWDRYPTDPDGRIILSDPDRRDPSTDADGRILLDAAPDEPARFAPDAAPDAAPDEPAPAAARRAVGRRSAESRRDAATEATIAADRAEAVRRWRERRDLDRRISEHAMSGLERHHPDAAHRPTPLSRDRKRGG